jgi:hypothetical protein
MRGKATTALALCASALLLALAAPAGAAECFGDECQGPPPAPEEILPGTAVVEGPVNPPARFPEARHPKKPAGHHKRHGKQGKRGKRHQRGEGR